MRHISVVAATILLSACSVHPLPDDLPAKKGTYQIVEAIRCEAKKAVLEHAEHARFKGAVIGYNFDFDITEVNEAAAGFELQKKFTDGTLLKLPWSGGSAKKTRRAQRQFTLVDKFEELRRAKCGDVDITSRSIVYPVTGSIGLYEVVSTFAKIESQTNFLNVSVSSGGGLGKDSQVWAFSDALTFTTEFNSGSFKPEVSLDTVPTGKLVLKSANITAGGTESGRTDTHKLTVALTLANGAEQQAAAKRAAAADPSIAMSPTAQTRSRLQEFTRTAPVVTFARTQGISELDVQSADDATARVLLELARRRQEQDTDQRLQLLLQLAKP
jgi:hypothetical protein